MAEPLTGKEEKQARILLAQARLAVAAQIAAGIATVFFTAWHGLPGFLLGSAAVWLFGLAKPEFPPELKKKLE